MLRRLFLLAFLAACGGSGDPESGTWSYLDFDVSSPGCDVSKLLTNDGTLSLANHGDGTFTITPGGGAAPFDCSIDGGTFYCAERRVASGSLDGRARVEGSFSEDTFGTGRHSVEVFCTGTDCAELEAAYRVAFPCTYTADFAIARADR